MALCLELIVPRPLLENSHRSINEFVVVRPPRFPPQGLKSTNTLLAIPSIKSIVVRGPSHKLTITRDWGGSVFRLSSSQLGEPCEVRGHNPLSGILR